MTQYHPEVPMTNTQTHPIVPMTEIPRGAPGRPLAEGHLEAHHLLVDAVEELKASVATLTNAVQQLQASDTAITLAAGQVQVASSALPLTLNPGDAAWSPNGITTLTWGSGGVGTDTVNNVDGMTVPTAGVYIGEHVINFGATGITAPTYLRVTWALETNPHAATWDNNYAWYYNNTVFNLADVTSDQVTTTSLKLHGLGRCTNPSISALVITNLNVNPAPVTITGCATTLMRLSPTYVPNA